MTEEHEDSAQSAGGETGDTGETSSDTPKSHRPAPATPFLIPPSSKEFPRGADLVTPGIAAPPDVAERRLGQRGWVDRADRAAETQDLSASPIA